MKLDFDLNNSFRTLLKEKLRSKGTTAENIRDEANEAQQKANDIRLELSLGFLEKLIPREKEKPMELVVKVTCGSPPSEDQSWRSLEMSE